MLDDNSPLFLIVFNGTIKDGCDYAVQTLWQLQKHGKAIGFCLGEPITWRALFHHSLRLSEYVENNTLIIRPFFFIPGQRLGCIKRLNILLNEYILRFYISIQFRNRKKIIWLFEPFFAKQTLKIFKNYESVYDCVDYFYEFSQDARTNEQYILSHATHVYANSNTLADLLRRQRKDVNVVPLGFAESIFFLGIKKKIPNTRKRKKIVGYVGGIDDRIDFKLLYGIIKHFSKLEFHFYGKICIPPSTHSYTEYKNIQALPNIFFHPEVPKQHIPSVIKQFNACLIPYRTDLTFNKFCFPMKTMEYFYMGKPIVSTRITELRRYKEHIFFMRTIKEGVMQIEKAIHPLSRAKANQEKGFAIQNSWYKKVSTICNFLGIPQKDA